MVSRRTRVASWIFRRDHPSRPKAMICCFFSSFKTFAMLREATYPPAAVNVLDVSSESMAAFQVFMYGRFWVFTEDSVWVNRIRYAKHYSVDMDRVFMEPKPHDCDFIKAPLGMKHCHFDKSVVTQPPQPEQDWSSGCTSIGRRCRTK